ncbi:MAG: hypothetical protein BIFFINMI_01383 [Phycisphaerae bacterium]|nr:hypothetical protein [Phycisphaerae bacterium]
MTGNRLDAWIAGLLLLAATAMARADAPASQPDVPPGPQRDASTREYGYVDAGGKWVIPAQWAEARPFSEDRAVVKSREGFYGYIGRDGKPVGKLVYKKVYDFADGMGVVQLGTRWGILGPDGEAAVEPKYDSIAAPSEGLCVARSAGAWFYLDAKGREIGRDEKWQSIQPIKDGLGRVQKNGRWGIVDSTGKVLIEPRFFQMQDFSHGLAAVFDQGGWGYINRKGEMVIQPQFAQVAPFSDGLAIVRTRSNTVGAVNEKGELVIPAKYRSIGQFTGGTAVVTDEHGKAGIIGQGGDVIVPVGYDAVCVFAGDMARVCRNGKWGYVDRKARVVIPPAFDQADDFGADGKASVSIGALAARIDRNGRITDLALPTDKPVASGADQGLEATLDVNARADRGGAKDAPLSLAMQLMVRNLSNESLKVVCTAVLIDPSGGFHLVTLSDPQEWDGKLLPSKGRQIALIGRCSADVKPGQKVSLCLAVASGKSRRVWMRSEPIVVTAGE